MGICGSCQETPAPAAVEVSAVPAVASAPTEVSAIPTASAVASAPTEVSAIPTASAVASAPAVETPTVEDVQAPKPAEASAATAPTMVLPHSHAVKVSNTHVVHYPDHPPREDTALYRRTHKELCLVQDLPCFACDRTRKEHKVQTETHHFFCEKAAEKAVDWITFGRKAQHLYNVQTGLHIGSAFDWKKVQENPDLFVDSTANMVVLCPECHRSSTRGIHHVPFPEWILQAYAMRGFKFL